MAGRARSTCGGSGEYVVSSRPDRTFYTNTVAVRLDGDAARR